MTTNSAQTTHSTQITKHGALTSSDSSPLSAAPSKSGSSGFRAVFLGTGTASSEGLGNSACLIERENAPWLMIDCGADALQRYMQHTNGALPTHLFITHLHFDHIGGLEQLFFKTCITQPEIIPTLYVPVQLVQSLSQILHNTAMADGRGNLWEVLRIVPVLENFWLGDVPLSAIPVRHHKPNTTFGLHLPGVFFYSADTRPIPEIVHHYVGATETILHDANLKANTSHAGVDELLAEYVPDVLQRMVIYHYPSVEVGAQIAAKGLAVASPGQPIALGH